MALSFSTLIAKGADTANFLQGQITADINQLDYINPPDSKHNQGLAGICNLKGRLITLLWIIQKDEETYHLLLPDSLGETVLAYLQKYLFRSKVALSLEPSSLMDLDQLPKALMIPWITPETSEKYVPQMVSLDILKGVHFKKGCYTGQEIVSRMHFLGKNKRRLAKVTAKSGPTIEINANLINDRNEPVGEIILVESDNALKTHCALAVINLAAVTEPLFIQEQPINLIDLWKNDDE